MKIGDTIVKRYIILKLLRQGESGAVFVCMDEKTGKMVALKQLVSNKATPAQLLWIKQEAQALLALNHPNLPKVVQHIEAPDANCLLLEYRDGTTLEQIVKKEGARSEVYALDVARVLVDVLGYLHSQKPPIICRDLSPANILRRKDGQLGLIDFDLSKIFDSAKGPGAKATGYSAPEQNGGPTDTTGDLYSLGATLYFLLTGVAPPPGGDLMAGRSALTPIRQACPGLSDTLASAVERLMTLNRAERPRTVEEAVTLLGLGPVAAEPEPEPEPEPVPEPEPEPAPEPELEPAPLPPPPEPEPDPEPPPEPVAAIPEPEPATQAAPPPSPPAPVKPWSVGKVQASATETPAPPTASAAAEAAPAMKPFIPGSRRPVQLPPTTPPTPVGGMTPWSPAKPMTEAPAPAPPPTPNVPVPTPPAPSLKTQPSPPSPSLKPWTPGGSAGPVAKPFSPSATPGVPQKPSMPPRAESWTPAPAAAALPVTAGLPLVTPAPAAGSVDLPLVTPPPAPPQPPLVAWANSTPVVEVPSPPPMDTRRPPPPKIDTGRPAPPPEPTAWTPPIEVGWAQAEEARDTDVLEPQMAEPDTLRPGQQPTVTQQAGSGSPTQAGGQHAADRQAGEVLNHRYRIERVLGVGGMGAVYLASHLELDEPVAIKEMRPPNFDDETREDCIRQFRIEARILNRLHHPNLPRVYDFFESNDRHYLVMDYIRGVTLDHAPPPDEATVLRWAGDLCDVLGYLHQQDPPVIFRDLKPTNIMLAEDGTIRLIDFGIAKVFEKDKGATTRTIIQGAVSHGYAAPEQYGGGTDQRLDIYALGAVLYFLLMRKDPPSSMDLIAGVVDFVSLKEGRPDLSEWLHTAVEWMMSLARDMRPGSMQECRAALGLGDTAAPVEASMPVQMRRLLREEFHYFFPAPWVERGTVLNEAYGNVMALHHPPLILLTGTSGVGKSRLLDELSRKSATMVRVLPRIRGGRLIRNQPFGALMPSMQALLAEEGEKLLATLMVKLDQTALHEMSQLFPQLRSLEASDTITPLAPLERNRVLLDSFRTVLEEVARSCPRLLLCFDDVQWLDSATLRLVDAILATEGRELPIVMALALETGQPNDAFEDALPRWQRRTEVAELPMTGFDKDELREYMRTGLPPIADIEKHLDTLLSITGGNPLLVEETIRWMVLRRMIEVKNGMLFVRELRPEVLPTTVLDAVRRRLELLPVDSQELLAVASVAGQIFTTSVLERLSSMSPQVIEESLSRAREAVFVRPGDGVGVWEFVSEGTREAFYARLPAPQRRQLHLTLGRIEEEFGKDLPGASQGYHFEQAGDVEKSLEHLSKITAGVMQQGTVEIVVRDGANATKSWADVAELTDEQVEKLKQAMAFIARSLKSMSSYGAHSPVVKTSVEMAISVLCDLQSEVGTCLVKCAEGFYAFNNRELDARHAPPEVTSACRRHHISGFEFRPGLDAAEMTRFLDVLANSHEIVLRDGGWEPAMASRQITTIQVIDTVLVEVSERDLFDPAKLRQSQLLVKSESEAFSFDKARAEAPQPPRPLDDAMVSNKEVGAQLASIQGLLEQVKASSAVRGSAVAEAVGGGNSVNADPELDESWDWLSKQAQREEILRLATLARRVDKPLMAYLEERPDIMLQEIESYERERRTLAAMGILNLGSRARQVLLNYLSVSDSAQGRAVAVFLLGQLVDDVAALLIARLVESSEETEVVRLLTIMQENRLPWVAALELLLPSSSTAVRRAVARVVLDAPLAEAEKADILRGALHSENPLVALDALQAVTELGRSELIPDVAKLLDRGWGKSSPDTVRAQVQACHTLAHIGTPESVLNILKGVASKGKLTSTFLGGRDSEVRSAAAWAIGRLQCPEGRDFLGTLLKDNDYAVRGAARLALETPGVQDTVGKERDFMEEIP